MVLSDLETCEQRPKVKCELNTSLWSVGPAKWNGAGKGRVATDEVREEWGKQTTGLRSSVRSSVHAIDVWQPNGMFG